MSLIQARSHTFMEIDHETISSVILLPSTDSRRVVVSYKRKYVHEVLLNYIVKLAQEKSGVRWSDRPDMTIAVDWDVKNQTKHKTSYAAIKLATIFYPPTKLEGYSFGVVRPFCPSTLFVRPEPYLST